MLYHQTMSLKNGALCVLRNAEGTDAESFLDYFLKAHGETDFLTTYPEEANRDLVKIAALLDSKTQSARSIEIIAAADGKVRPVEVRIGINNGVSTEIVGSELKEGDMVVNAAQVLTAEEAAARGRSGAARSPFLPDMPKRRSNNPNRPAR